jgi:hypothetical protein
MSAIFQRELNFADAYATDEPLNNLEEEPLRVRERRATPP